MRWRMPRVAFPLQLDAKTRDTLDKFVYSSSGSRSLAMRSRIVLAAAGGSNNRQIAASLKIPPITVGKWRRSFAINGLEGLRDAPRSGQPPQHDSDTRHKVQTRVSADVGLPASTVHAMLVADKLQPHRIRTLAFSPDPDFEARLLEIVGLYLNPPENALVLCVDENTGIQALNRTQPGLTLRADKPCACTNEYVRHGTRMLVAALEIATGNAVSHVGDRRTTVDLLGFMDDLVKSYPVSELHVLLDNPNIHKNQAAEQWLLSHPRVQLHYTPAHASWMNMVDCVFSILTRRALTQSVDRSKQDLKEFLIRYLKKHSENPTPFTWTKGPEHLEGGHRIKKGVPVAHPKKTKEPPK
jgi:hypothetical protein